MKLDFGSGYNPQKGYSTCDVTSSPYLDFLFDGEKIISRETGSEVRDNTFEEIHCKNVLHHVEDVEKLLNYLKNKLTFGGQLIIIDSNKSSYQRNLILDLLWYRFVIPTYEIWFSKEYRDLHLVILNIFQNFGYRKDEYLEEIRCFKLKPIEITPKLKYSLKEFV